MAVISSRIDVNGFKSGDIVSIAPSWENENRVGEVAATSFRLDGISWTVVRWVGSKDPDCHKTRGLVLLRKHE